MNKISFVLLLICASISSNCQSIKTFVPKLQTTSKNFEISNATYKKWNGGQPNIKGYIVSFTINNVKVSPDTLYFRNQKTMLKLNETSQKFTYEGSFIIANKPDFILHENPINEHKNQVPNFTKNIPFKLMNNEAVFHYKFQKTSYYYKISSLKQVH